MSTAREQLAALREWLANGNAYMEHPDGQEGTDRAVEALDQVLAGVSSLRAPQSGPSSYGGAEMSRYQVWRCTWCGGVRLQPPEYPIATAASAEIHACSPTEGSYMIMVGYIEIEPGVVRAAPREPPNEKREILPSFHGEYPEEDLAIGRAIRDQCIEMEHIPLERIVDAYGAFCGSVHCSGYMDPTPEHLLWFTTWLLGRCLRLEKELPGAAPREPSPEAIKAADRALDLWAQMPTEGRLSAPSGEWLRRVLRAAYAVDGVPE